MKSSDKITRVKQQIFIKSANSSSPSGSSGALPPIGKNYVYIESSGKTSGIENVLCFSREKALFRLDILVSISTDFQKREQTQLWDDPEINY